MDTPEFKRVIRGYDQEAVEHAWSEIQLQLFQSNAANNELRLQFNSLREQNSESNVANNELRLQIDSLQEQNSKSNTTNNELRLQIDSLEEQNSESNAANNELTIQINSLQEQNSECENRLKYYEQIEKDIVNVLLSAQQIANREKEEASKQADNLIQSARSESETLLTETTRILKLKENESEKLILNKQSKILLIEERIKELVEQKTELQTRVDQAINFLEMAMGLLEPPKLLCEHALNNSLVKRESSIQS